VNLFCAIATTTFEVVTNTAHDTRPSRATSRNVYLCLAIPDPGSLARPTR